MKKIIAQFKVITETNETTQKMTFTAYILTECKRMFRLQVNQTHIKNNKTDTIGKTIFIYENSKELTNNYMYHYNLCKNNLFTKSIKITKIWKNK